MANEALFLSIRPEFVVEILAGRKCVELRRLMPRALPGSLVVKLYISVSPSLAVADPESVTVGGVLVTITRTTTSP